MSALNAAVFFCFFFTCKQEERTALKSFTVEKKGCWFPSDFGQTQLPNAAHHTSGADVGRDVWRPGSTGRRGGSQKVLT